MPLFETLAILALIFGVAAAVTLNEIRSWISAHVSSSTADLIRTELASGNVRIVAIGLTDSGRRTSSTNSWEAKSLDSDLAARFGRRNTVRVHV